MIVVDASVLVTALAAGAGGDGARARLAGERLIAPALVDLEVISVLRGLVHSGQLDVAHAGAAVSDLAALPLERVPHTAFLPRIWELRENITPYDVAYVALAEALDAPLVTGDRRLARSTGSRCRVEVLPAD